MNSDADWQKELYQSPEDRTLLLAYADWLTEHDNPRGEFIHVQFALEDATLPGADRSRFREVEKQLLSRYEREWLGDLAPFLLGDKPSVSYSWGRGWLDRLTIPELTTELAEALANAPQTRLVRELRILRLGTEETNQVGVLAASSHFSNVRILQLGESSEETLRPLAGTVAALVRQLRGVEELYLYASPGAGPELFRLDSLQHLRVLDLREWVIRDLDALAENPSLKRLQRLSLQPESANEDAELSLEDLRLLLRCRALRKLRHLALYRCENGDRLCRLIVRAPLLDHLMSLRLSHSRITDRGAALLAQCEALVNLELVDLSDNFIGRRGLARLDAAGINYQADDQRRPDDEGFSDEIQE
jgi:uncharacterized protein (TIGR02996 family)